MGRSQLPRPRLRSSHVGIGLPSRSWRGDEMGLDQPLRSCAPPPHKWGGASALGGAYGIGTISPSGAARHLPINGEEPAHEWGGASSLGRAYGVGTIEGMT